MNSWVEWIGYAASAFIAVSLLMTNMRKLRIINTIGCLVFMLYGWLVGAYPVLIANGAIVVINLYQLFCVEKCSPKNK